MGTVNTLLCANTLAAVLPLNEHKEKLIIPNAEKKSRVLRIGKIAPGDKRKGIPKEPVLKEDIISKLLSLSLIHFCVIRNLQVTFDIINNDFIVSSA